MAEFREFVEGAGVPAAALFTMLAMVFYGGRAVWARISPLVEQWFTRHFSLIDSLINRNEQQIVHDDASMQRLAVLLTKRDACSLAEHHCKAIECLASGDSVAVNQHVSALREELRRMKDSDADRDARGH